MPEGNRAGVILVHVVLCCVFIVAGNFRADRPTCWPHHRCHRRARGARRPQCRHCGRTCYPLRRPLASSAVASVLTSPWAWAWVLDFMMRPSLRLKPRRVSRQTRRESTHQSSSVARRERGPTAHANCCSAGTVWEAVGSRKEMSQQMVNMTPEPIKHAVSPPAW